MFAFLDEIYSMSGLSLDLLKSGFRLINMANKCVYLEGFLRIKSVSQEKIEVSLKKGAVLVSGANLKIKNMSRDTLMIVGEIDSMESKR